MGAHLYWVRLKEDRNALLILASTDEWLTKYNAVAEVVYDAYYYRDYLGYSSNWYSDNSRRQPYCYELTNNVDQADIATSSSTQYGMVVAKIDADDGSFIWRKWYDPYNSTFPDNLK